MRAGGAGCCPPGRAPGFSGPLGIALLTKPRRQWPPRLAGPDAARLTAVIKKNCLEDRDD